jgi:hypothetical protein
MHTMTTHSEADVRLPRLKFIRQSDRIQKRHVKGISRHGKKYRAYLTRRGHRQWRDCETLQQAQVARRQMLAAAPPCRRTPTKNANTNTGIKNISDVTRWIRNHQLHCLIVNRRHAIYYGPKSRTRRDAMKLAKRLVGTPLVGTRSTASQTQ